MVPDEVDGDLPPTDVQPPDDGLVTSRVKEAGAPAGQPERRVSMYPPHNLGADSHAGVGVEAA